MSPRQISARIPLQVGSELRIRNSGELRVSQRLNPEKAADAALDYHFDPETAEHVLRLVSPVKSQRLLTEPRRAISPSLPPTPPATS